MLPRRRAVATCLTGVLALLTAAPAAAATLEGSAFLDRDGDGVLSAGDAPVAGALVALGATHFTRTDAAGRYTLEVGDGADGILWVSVPATGAPGPAWAPVRAARGEVSVDLAIVPVDPAAAATPLTFVVAADAHMDGVAGRWSADELTAALVQALALPAPPRFFTIVGDITQANRPEDFAAVNRGLDAITVPWVPVPGNHDWYDGGAAWRATWGPDAYSFDVGAVHVVVWNSSAPLDETLALLREDLRAVAPEATVIALGHEPPTDGLAAAMRRLGVDALFTGHWHANRVVDHDGLLELNTQPLLMGGIDLTPAGYRIVTIGEDDLRVDHHSVVSAPVLHVAWPTDERCHRGALDLLVAAGAGAGLDAVRATIGDATLALTPAGGWLWRGRLPARADGLDRVEVVALAGGREVARTDAPIFVCDPALSDGPAPRAGDWPQVQGGPEHRGATRLADAAARARVGRGGRRPRPPGRPGRRRRARLRAGARSRRRRSRRPGRALARHRRRALARHHRDPGAELRGGRRRRRGGRHRGRTPARARRAHRREPLARRARRRPRSHPGGAVGRAGDPRRRGPRRCPAPRRRDRPRDRRDPLARRRGARRQLAGQRRRAGRDRGAGDRRVQPDRRAHRVEPPRRRGPLAGQLG